MPLPIVTTDPPEAQAFVAAINAGQGHNMPPRDLSPAALRALAMIAIQGDTCGVRWSTRAELGFGVLYEINRDLNRPGIYKLTEEGLAEARKSPLYRCHEFLVAAGYRVERGRRRRKGSYIPYTDDTGADALPGHRSAREAFVSGYRPTVYVKRADSWQFDLAYDPADANRMMG